MTEPKAPSGKVIRVRAHSFFRKTNATNEWVVAAYHNPASITWKWALYFGLFRGDERRFWPLFMPGYRTAEGRPVGQERWAVRVPFIGILRYCTQDEMPISRLRNTEGAAS